MREINLVPDIKIKMIKALKLRNLVFFVCLVTSGVAIALTAITAGIMGGQGLTIEGQDKRLKAMSAKVSGYEGLNEFLTIQDQLAKIQSINEKKKVLSRVFGVLGVLLSQGKDKITLSELNVDLDNNMLAFDAQADAGVEPFIDYRVLESFKKKVGLMHYDYGRYVDEQGNEIPTRCLVETDDKGVNLSRNGASYVIWKRGEKGCDLIKKEEGEAEAEEAEGAEGEGEKKSEKKEVPAEVEIWRKPLFREWYKSKNMELSGAISGVPHFESKCISYTGEENDGEVKWTAVNNCKMTDEGVKIRDSSNGRDSSGRLVLRFGATIQMNQDIFAFKNKHVAVIAPNDQNVTDSYVQIESMFEKKAADCLPGDAACKANNKNQTGKTE